MKNASFKYYAMIALSFIWITSQANVNEHFNSIKTNPTALYSFFKSMPKGGELHYHFSGSAYPSLLIAKAMQGKYCINPQTFDITSQEPICKGEDANLFLNNKDHYAKTVRAWSMKNFVSKFESNHDHFFNVFGKVTPIYNDFSVPLLKDMVQRAASQHELYMEIMMLTIDNTEQFSKLINKAPTLAMKRHILLANKDFQNNIQKQVDASKFYLKQLYKELECDKNPINPACEVTVRFQFWVKREESLDDVFVQALTGFEASKLFSNIVGVNLVQPETGTIALRDFNAQMHIFDYLHTTYPDVNIALHAGELAPNATPPKDLRFHIRNSVYIGHAKRIGHGVDILSEDKHDELTKYMARHQVSVEINLTSNHVILLIDGNKHPIVYYLKQGVPIMLSTDDEGILLTNLTQQYVTAATVHKIDYANIKDMNRNALTYSFLPGKSIWLNPAKHIMVPACRELNSSACKFFIKKNEKARLQWDLENKLLKFEAQF